MEGVSELLTSLPTFMGTFSFFGDELHMIGHGLGHLVYNLLDPKRMVVSKSKALWNTLLISINLDISKI